MKDLMEDFKKPPSYKSINKSQYIKKEPTYYSYFINFIDEWYYYFFNQKLKQH